MKTKPCRDKRCERSGQPLPLSEFTKNRRNDDGHSDQCGECSRRRNREQYQRDQERKHEDPGVTRKARKVDHEKVRGQVFTAIRSGYDTRDRIRRETRLNEEVISDALADLYDRNQIRITGGRFYPVAQAA